MANERVVQSDEGKKLADELGKFFSFRSLFIDLFSNKKKKQH